jgi:hypothetical protein
MGFRIAPLTAAGLLALGSINAWLLTTVTLGGEPREQESVTNVASSLNLTEATGGLIITRAAAAYRETLAHPVFYKTRQPFIPPPPAPPPAAPKPAALPVPADPGIALGGVAINSDLRKVYLLSKANSLGTWVGEGEAFMGWTVQSVGPEGAKLRQADRELRLELYPSR